MTPGALGAVVYDRGDPVDEVLHQVARSAQAGGARVAGLVQQDEAGQGCAQTDMGLLDLASGERLSICQNLGSGAQSCRIDPRAMAEAGARLARVLEVGAAGDRPDLVIVNKFGKLECEGGGLLAEIGLCVALGVPLLVGVPRRFLPQWQAFAGEIGTALPCSPDAIEAWWRAAHT